jgi:hypothetical protein
MLKIKTELNYKKMEIEEITKMNEIMTTIGDLVVKSNT